MPLELPELVEQVRALGLYRTPPAVLLTRWQALVGEDEVIFFDAALEAGADVAGSRYTFVALTDVAVCRLVAEHHDEAWEHDRHMGRSADEITPRSVDAWRRPIRAVSEIGLGGVAWDWLPVDDGSRATYPAIRLVLGDVELELPLRVRHRQRPPDVAPVLAHLRGLWDSFR